MLPCYFISKICWIANKMRQWSKSKRLGDHTNKSANGIFLLRKSNSRFQAPSARWLLRSCQRQERAPVKFVCCVRDFFSSDEEASAEITKEIMWISLTTKWSGQRKKFSDKTHPGCRVVVSRSWKRESVVRRSHEGQLVSIENYIQTGCGSSRQGFLLLLPLWWQAVAFVWSSLYCDHGQGCVQLLIYGRPCGPEGGMRWKKKYHFWCV